MWKLVKLEWKKNQTGRFIRKAAVLAALLCLFLFAFAYLGIANDPDTGVPDTAPGYDTISVSVELFTNMSYLLFTSVMLSSFLISAFQNGTMKLMFSYPIRRQRILAAQMLAVWSFCFTALALTKVLVYGCILAGSRSMVSAFPLDFHMGQSGFWIQLILRSASTVTMAFLCLPVGMAFHSSKAALITSFLLFFLTQGNIGEFTLSHQTLFPVILILAALASAFLVIYKIEEKDVS